MKLIDFLEKCIKSQFITHKIDGLFLQYMQQEVRKLDTGEDYNTN